MNKKITLASIGDCCIDHYTHLNKDFLGGTAYNIAANAQKAGAETAVFSAVGNDIHGKHFKNYFQKHGINTEGLEEINGQTSKVDVTLDTSASPTYTNWNLGVLSGYNLTKQHETLLKQYDIARVMHLQQIAHLLDMFATFDLPNTLKVADFDGETLYTEKTIIIENYIDKLDMIIKSIEESDTKETTYFRSLAERYPEKYFLLLLGKNGSVVYHKNKTVHQPSLPPKKIIDTNGAGDNYIGHFLVTLKQTNDLKKAMYEGAKKASESLTHFGGVT